MKHRGCCKTCNSPLCVRLVCLFLSLIICVVLIAVDMVDELPHVVIGGSFGLEHSPVLVGDVADAAVDGAAVEGDLSACGILQNDVRTHGDIILALVEAEANQNIGVLDQILGACEQGSATPFL